MTSIGHILPSVVGDLVNLPGEKKTYAIVRCDLPTEPEQALACLTCRQLLANHAQLVMHLQLDLNKAMNGKSAANGQHVIARLCPEHGWEATEIERKRRLSSDG